MTSNAKNLSILFGVLIPASLASVVYLTLAGPSDDSLNLLLRVTARASFMIYLLIFVARPLQQLAGTDWSRWLLRERRSLGIAFAAMHTVHLGLIALRYGTIAGLHYELLNGIFGATAYALIYLMLITSFDAPARAIGPKIWRRLHKTGLYFIGAIFLATLLPEPGQAFFTIDRAWFFLLTAGAVFIRLTAWFARRNQRRGNQEKI